MSTPKRALISLLVSASVALMLTGCSVFGKKDKERAPMKLEPIAAGLDVDRVWSRSIGKGPGRAGNGLVPRYADDALWVADRRGHVESLDLRTGQRLWSVDLDLPLSAGPTPGDDVIALGTLEGQAVLLERASGEVRWRAQLSSEVIAPPVMQDDLVVVRCIDGRVFGLEKDTGQRRWVYDRSVPLLTLRGNSRPLIRGRQLFIGHDDGSVTALSLEDGRRLWEQRVGTGEGRTELDRLADIDGPMAIVGLDLYAASRHGRTVSIALDSGRLLWVKNLGAWSGLTVNRSELAISDTEDRVHLLDRRSGSTIWTNEKLLRRGLSRPAFQGEFVVVADNEGYLHWLSRESGEFVARRETGSKRLNGGPLVVDELVVLYDQDGKLSVWRLAGGN